MLEPGNAHVGYNRLSPCHSPDSSDNSDRRELKFVVRSRPTSPLAPLRGSLGDPEIPSTFHVRDLELMHHYASDTAPVMCDIPQFLNYFQNSVPKQAFKHDCLMHSLLAVTALHLNYIRPRDASLLPLAFKHHQLSIASQRQGLEVLNKENCEAVFVSSAFIVIVIAALGRLTSMKTQASTPLDHIINVFVFRRGYFLMSRSCRGWLLDTDLAPSVKAYSIERFFVREHSLLAPLVQLEQRNQQSSASKDEINMYSVTIAGLHKWFYHSVIENGHASVATTWPCLVDESFIRAMRAEKPMALAILAHFCVMLHKSCRVWWFEGFGKRLLYCIASKLPDSWQDSIAWAKDEVGLCDEQLGTSPVVS